MLSFPYHMTTDGTYFITITFVFILYNLYSHSNIDINAYRVISIPNAHSPYIALLAKKKILIAIISELLLTPK